MISYLHGRNNPQLLRQRLSNFCTFFTYSAVTAVCLRIPYALSFSPTTFTTTTHHSYYNLSPPPSVHANSFHSSNSLLFIRGGASNNSNLYKPRTIFNMASTTSESKSTTDEGTSKTINVDPKLSALRSKMKALGIDAFIVPTDDPHLSEYVPTAYMRRKFLTGFGGSAGTAVVTQDEALLWTDSR